MRTVYFFIDGGVPTAIVQGRGLPIEDASGVETIDSDKYLFMGLLTTMHTGKNPGD